MTSTNIIISFSIVMAEQEEGPINGYTWGLEYKKLYNEDNRWMKCDRLWLSPSSLLDDFPLIIQDIGVFRCIVRRYRHRDHKEDEWYRTTYMMSRHMDGKLDSFDEARLRRNKFGFQYMDKRRKKWNYTRPYGVRPRRCLRNIRQDALASVLHNRNRFSFDSCIKIFHM